MFNVQSKPTGSQFSLEKQKRKPLNSPVSVKAVRWKGWGLWREGFKEKVSFEFRVKKSRSDLNLVLLKETHNEMSGQRFLNRNMMMMVERG